MRFEVRDPNPHPDKPPCRGAEWGLVPQYDTRIYPTFEFYETLTGEPFTAHGRAHETLPHGAGIRRIMGQEERWSADLSVVDLIGLSREYGEILLLPPPGPEALPIVHLGGWE